MSVEPLETRSLLSASPSPLLRLVPEARYPAESFQIGEYHHHGRASTTLNDKAVSSASVTPDITGPLPKRLVWTWSKGTLPTSGAACLTIVDPNTKLAPILVSFTYTSPVAGSLPTPVPVAAITTGSAAGGITLVPPGISLVPGTAISVTLTDSSGTYTESGTWTVPYP